VKLSTTILNLLGIGVAAAIAGPLQAEGAKPAYPDFTFRRVAPPTTGAGPRITIQIDPEEQARRLAAFPDVTPRTPADAQDEAAARPEDGVAGAYGWYWDIVPPLRAARAVPFETALAALQAGPSGQAVAGPRLQTLQDLAARFGPDILRASVGTRVSPALALAVMAVESGGRVAAESPRGAQGLMQLIPATAARFSVSDSLDPAQNIRGGIAYLDWLMREFDGDPLLVLAGYNAGEGAVRSHGGVPPYAETRAYVPKVLAAWSVARGLCRTPPELVSDGCVFQVAAR
jgi:soluble lytic murein transglycosylase-like protein